jgi:hypothetical protein
MRGSKLANIVVLAALVGLLCSCAPLNSITIGRSGHHSRHHDDHQKVGHRGAGPPPHAPAHGYRHKHKQKHGGDVDLVFDSELGVYAVIGIPDRYYWNGHYLRIDDGQWSVSIDLGSEWKPRSEDSLPTGLRKKHAGKHEKHDKKHKKEHKKAKKHSGKGRGAAKGNW